MPYSGAVRSTKTTTVNFSLPAKMRSEVERKISREAYGSFSEYVRELIRKDLRREAIARVDELLLEGERSGKPIPVTKKWLKDLQAKVKKPRRRV